MAKKTETDLSLISEITSTIEGIAPLEVTGNEDTNKIVAKINEIIARG